MAVPSLLMHSVKCTENLVKFGYVVFAICDCTDLTQACLSAILFWGAEYIVISHICNAYSFATMPMKNFTVNVQITSIKITPARAYIILHIKKISVHNLCETDNTRKWHCSFIL